MLIPCGHRVLIKQKEVSKEVQLGDGGPKIEIVNPEDLDLRREQQTVTEGTIVRIGPDAWKAFRTIDREGVLRNGAPWAEVGERVYFAKFAGHEVTDPETEEKFYLINDEDVTVVIREGAN